MGRRKPSGVGQRHSGVGSRPATGKRSARQTLEKAAEAIGMKLLLDTTVLIDVLRDRKGRRELLADLVRAGHSLSTSALNIAEVYGGIRSGEEGRTEAFLAGLDEFGLEGGWHERPADSRQHGERKAARLRWQMRLWRRSRSRRSAHYSPTIARTFRCRNCACTQCLDRIWFSGTRQS